MHLRVTGSAVTVEEPDDCTSLSIRIVGMPPYQIDAALDGAGLGRMVDPGHAALDIARLRQLAAAGATGPDWPVRWDRMLAYAARSGWLSADGTSVRAHIEISD